MGPGSIAVETDVSARYGDELLTSKGRVGLCSPGESKARVTGQRQLTSGEKELIKAAASDTEADLRGLADGQEAVIRAEVLLDLITDANPQWPVKDRIRMVGARIRGPLDLAGADLAHALQFAGSVFEGPEDLRLARTRKPEESDRGQPEAITADEFETGADLIIQNVTVTGLISLHWANIRGDLRLTGSRLIAPGGQVFNGKDLRVGGSLFLDGRDFRAQGEVCLRSAHVEGQIDCRHARFSNPLGHTINADHLVVDGELLCEEGFRSAGEVCLQWAKVWRLRATGGSFRSSTTYALHADALRAEAGIYLDRGFHATATVRLVGANITGELCCTEGHFDNPSGRALDAERIVAEDVYLDRGFRAHGDVRFNDADVARQFNATAGKFRNERRGDNQYALDCDGLRCDADVFLNDGFNAIGTVSLRGAQIKTELNCTAASFTKPDGCALFADGLATPGMVFLDRDFRADGEIRFARATVGRQLVCTGGAFSNPSGTALDMSGLVTPGDVLLNDGFQANGEVRMRGADIARDLDFTGARLNGPKGLIARGMRVGGRLIWKMESPPEGPVDLSLANISRLDDTWRSWPTRKYILAGLTYGITADGDMTVDPRIEWLRGTKAYSADAYQQLVQSYTLSGDQKSADRVAIESQRDLRKRGKLGWLSRRWNKFIDLSVGYGYKLHRPFVTLLIAGGIGGCIFWAAQHADLIVSTGTSHISAMKAPPAAYPPFYPFPYAFQLLIPGLDLRETANWLPYATKSGWGLFLMILVWLMIIFGWVLATAVAAGITRIFRRR